MKPHVLGSRTDGQLSADSIQGQMDTTLKGCPVVHGPRERIEAAVHPTDAVDPDTTNVNGSRNPHTSATIPLDSEGFTTIRASEAPHDGQPTPTARTQRKPSRPARAPARARKAAELLAAGMPFAQVATEIGCVPSTLWRMQRQPYWPDLTRRAQATVAADTEAEMAAGRLEAVRALRRVVAPVDGTAAVADPNEVSSAARALLQASAPPGELVRARAAREARAAWTAALAPEAPDVRARVLGRIEGSYDALSTEELERLAGER
jgi:hypothetical protein